MNFNYKALQVMHCVAIALIVVPNTMYYASANVLSSALQQHFQAAEIQPLSFQLITITSIFSTVLFSFAIDAFQYKLMYPIFQGVIILGSVFSIISFPVERKELYLTGRFLYGLAGESTLSAQAKVISVVVNERFQTMAFAVAFCGYMAGEALAGAVMPQVSLLVGHIIVCALQVASFLIILAYGTCHQQYERIPLSLRIKSTFRLLKTLKSNYFLLAAFRICYHAAKSTWDTRSVQIYRDIFHVDNNKAQYAQVLQTACSAVFFVVSGALAIWEKMQYVLLVTGVLLSLVAFIVTFLAVSSPMLAAVFLGAGYGCFSATCSGLLVRRAGVKLASSALGVVFSIQYIIISVLIEVCDIITKKYGEKYNIIIIFVLIVLGVVFWATELILNRCNKQTTPQVVSFEVAGVTSSICLGKEGQSKGEQKLESARRTPQAGRFADKLQLNPKSTDLISSFADLNDQLNDVSQDDNVLYIMDQSNEIDRYLLRTPRIQGEASATTQKDSLSQQCSQNDHSSFQEDRSSLCARAATLSDDENQ